jgi:OmpA-OmpF porin, OOP family
MRLRTALIAAGMMATPVVAMAQPITGLYIGAGVGLNAPADPRASGMPGSHGGHLTINEDFGINGNVAVGYGIGNGFRFEIEGDGMNNGVRNLQGTRFFPTQSNNGSLTTYGVMANALYDLDVGTPYVFPYVGLGAGYQWTNMDNVTFVEPNHHFGYSSSSQSGAFAAQAIVGASFPMPFAPGLSLTADYRFMDILGGEKFSGVGLSGTGTLISSGAKLSNQFENQFVLGVRYSFGAPPAPPPPTPMQAAVPAPTPARSYLVFFDWDKANLTDRARSIIKEAADNSTHVSYTRIAVNGYTDTSGTPQYNQGLSIRRAQAVAGELVRDGVPQNIINIQGFGDTHLLVATGPGVREPQNRRVEIVIQ